MKTLVHTVCAVAVMALPIATLAQSDGALTRAQVQGEIAQLQQAGFNPANVNTVDFPANMPATTGSKTLWIVTEEFAPPSYKLRVKGAIDPWSGRLRIVPTGTMN